MHDRMGMTGKARHDRMGVTGMARHDKTAEVLQDRQTHDTIEEA